LELVLPPGVTPAQFDRALGAFRAIVGDQWVLATDEDRETYLDAYALGDGRNHAASAALAPASVEEVQALLRAANEHRIPLWPVGRGKNLGYGHAAPRVSGTVVLDLGRMNRIIDVDARFAHALIEPGVGYFDLYDHLAQNNIPLWMSVPGNAWGSVIGNAMERGIGYTVMGDHTDAICGLEVVLPQGELIRTGMGAMAGNKAWQHYQHGFGPDWAQMFVQANYGVVTKAGMWLQPEPEMSAKVQLNLPRFEDISWAIDVLAELRRRDVIQHNIVFGNYLHDASVFSQRSDWYDGPGAIPDDVSQKIIDHYRIGWWSVALRLFGYEDTVKSHIKVIRELIEPRLGSALEFTEWRQGDPIEKSARGIPTVLPLQIVNWHGGRGGHMGFSPVMPPDGELALQQARRMKARFEEAGLDYYTSFTMGRRHISNVNLLIYDRDNADMIARSRQLFRTLIRDSAEAGYAEYRTHPEFMGDIAETFDFNDRALWRLNERLKDMLDPNGIIAPGKNGITAGWQRGTGS